MSRATLLRVGRCLVIGGLWGVLGHPLAGAQELGADPAAARITIILLTVVAALLLGILLYYLSQRSSQVGYKAAGEQTVGETVPHPADAKAVVPKEVERLGLPPEAAKSVRDIISRSVSEQVEVAKREVNERYGKLIEEQRRSNQAIQQKYQEALTERKQTVSVLESIAEGLVVVNNRGEVVMMNPAAERMLALNQKDRIGKPLAQDLKAGQLVSMVQGKNEDRDIVLSTDEEATKRVLRASNAMITDEDGRTVGMVAVLSDVTKQRELDQLKSEFVSKVSHELRTPIVAMQHALAILVDEVAGPLTAEQQKFASLTQRNLQRLNTLINDLLDLSKLEAKKMELRREPTALGELINTVCETMSTWAQSKAITVNKRVGEDLPTVLCDPHRVTQVLTNLVGNAIKFTPKQGRVLVEARRAQEPNAVEVSVADNGVGISKEDLPKLFNKFQQVGERTSSDITGTGLGLSICKEIVELHQGRIWAESDPVKKGARFAFLLPINPPESAPPRAGA
jgi:PAS domain S-box-containing protein